MSLLDIAPTIMAGGMLLWATDKMFGNDGYRRPNDSMNMMEGIMGLTIGASLLSSLKVDKVI